MEWMQLLSDQRLGKAASENDADRRSPFQRDFDRIVFSSAFRRLQDKTQVFPLPESDYVRTRLTHSLEVACVGRSLGEMVGAGLLDRHKELKEKFSKSDFGAIVGAACLAHDIGNPPFGHSGESAIQGWFENLGEHPALEKLVVGLKPREIADFLNFEGNAQGFRVLTTLQNANNRGGLQLTMATLATFMKYPREVKLTDEPKLGAGQSNKKFGFFQSEAGFAEEVATTVGLISKSAKISAWSRHPLAFLVEAADDICYRTIDFEDGYRLGYVSFEDARELLLGIVKGKDTVEKLKSIVGEKEQIEVLRARAINRMISEVVAVFMKRENEILAGAFDSELVAEIGSGAPLEAIRDLSKKHVYAARTVVEIEAAGFEVLGGLLGYFIPAAFDVAKRGKAAASPRSKKYLQLLSQSSQQVLATKTCSDYERVLCLTDFVSGMTDSFAVSMYKKMAGISLPGA